MIQWIENNALQFVVLVGGWLVVFGAMKRDVSELMKMTKHIETKVDNHIEAEAPHKGCVVHLEKFASIDRQLNQVLHKIDLMDDRLLMLLRRGGGME